MGIQGLLPLLKDVTETVNIRKFKGKTVAVDASCWLHRGAYVCATELCLGIPTNKYAIWCMKRIFMMTQNGVTPYVVFDGAQMPLKKNTENKRRGTREDSLAKGMAFHQQGNVQMATRHFQRAVRVNASMVCTFIQMLRDEGVTFTVAPYEADAQLAYLARNDIVDAVISEDSDLLAFGCKKVIFKMDDHGIGQMVSLDNVIGGRGKLRPFDLAQFRMACILSGCDYLNSISGIGIKKACDLVRKYRDSRKLFKGIRWNMKYTIPKGYEHEFAKAVLGFCHQRVFDPQNQKIVHMTPLPSSVLEKYSDDTFLGDPIDEKVGRDIATGVMNPRSKVLYPADILSKLDPGVGEDIGIGTLEPERNSFAPWGHLSKKTRTSLESAKQRVQTQFKSQAKQKGMDGFVKRIKRQSSAFAPSSSSRSNTRPMKRQMSLPSQTYSKARARSSSLVLQTSALSTPFRLPNKIKSHTESEGTQPDTPGMQSSFFSKSNSTGLQNERNLQKKLRKRCSIGRSAACVSDLPFTLSKTPSTPVSTDTESGDGEGTDCNNTIHSRQSVITEMSLARLDQLRASKKVAPEIENGDAELSKSLNTPRFKKKKGTSLASARFQSPLVSCSRKMTISRVHSTPNACLESLSRFKRKFGTEKSVNVTPVSVNNVQNEFVTAQKQGRRNIDTNFATKKIQWGEDRSTESNRKKIKLSNKLGAKSRSPIPTSSFPSLDFSGFLYNPSRKSKATHRNDEERKCDKILRNFA